MDRQWEITPELCGRSWIHLFVWSAALVILLPLIEYPKKPHSVVILLSLLFAVIMETRARYRSLRFELRLNVDHIAAIGTKSVAIRKQQIAKLRETSTWSWRGPGLIVSSEESTFLRGGREVFIPQTLPDFEFVRQTMQAWLEEANKQQRLNELPISPRGIPYNQ
jgi:hypothetical protein